ncbi:hypothetical protein [Thalassobellus sediminis]|uniref:hypothetical protein n=1 Tax=Thalassobellus sediminis TaxID=3367753 RepID=UPI0037A52259
MEKKTNQPTLIPKIYCSVFGHDYQVTKKVTYHVKEYTCCHCKKQLTTNSNGKLIELTPRFKEINDILERIHSKRILRSKTKTTASSIYLHAVKN